MHKHLTKTQKPSFDKASGSGRKVTSSKEHPRRMHGPGSELDGAPWQKAVFPAFKMRVPPNSKDKQEVPRIFVSLIPPWPLASLFSYLVMCCWLFNPTCEGRGLLPPGPHLPEEILETEPSTCHLFLDPSLRTSQHAWWQGWFSSQIIRHWPYRNCLDKFKDAINLVIHLFYRI